METDYINCFSCGAKALNLDGECHKYMLASPGCYEMFNEVLNKEYTDLRYHKGHHFTVDAYAIQHPGLLSNQKAVNSVGIHLVSLYCTFEAGFDLAMSAEIKTKFAQFNKLHKIIKPIKGPESFLGLTIFDIWDNDIAELHFDLCKQWAWDAFHSWSAHHKTIASWAKQFLTHNYKT
ncbi:DUF5946 family protein [Winogradskyella sp.]|uniref:DUF5946 family protein n=1 Tax=Winogradskyella sp. TaxID=1883156 RepID=UPI003BAC7C50